MFEMVEAPGIESKQNFREVRGEAVNIDDYDVAPNLAERQHAQTPLFLSVNVSKFFVQLNKSSRSIFFQPIINSIFVGIDQAAQFSVAMCTNQIPQTARLWPHAVLL